MWWWVFGFLLTVFSNNLYATSFEQADSLFRLRLYSEACVAYEQIVYENSGNESIKAKALLKKSYCYKAELNYSQIDVILSRCNVNELNDTIKSQILFERSFACYMTEKFAKAKEHILPIFNINSTPEIEKASTLLYSLILNELCEWDESKNNLISYLKRAELENNKQRDSLIQVVNIMYQKKNIPKLKKVKTGRLMSFILPGTGQTYAGKPQKGLVSLSLVALSGTFIYFNVVGQIYTSTAVGIYLFSYFYTGNVNQVKPLVEKRNNSKKNEYNAFLRSQLIKLNKQIN